MLTRPAFVPDGIAAAPVDFRWSESTALGILDPPPTRLARLASRYAPLHPLAAFAMLLGAFEWVLWRFEGHGETTEFREMAQAGYLALSDPRRVRLDAYEEPEDSDASPVQGPLVTGACLLAEGFDLLAAGDERVKQSAFCMALLARHVVPDDDALQAWLADRLKAFAARYPASQDGAAPVLARAALSPGGDLDAAALRAAQVQWRDALATTRNPWVQPAGRRS